MRERHSIFIDCRLGMWYYKYSMARCTHCGCPLRKNEEASSGTGVGVSLPWWLWLLPVPLFSAIFTRSVGPSFCSIGCRDAHMQNHPRAWVFPFLGVHLIFGAPIIWALINK